MVHSLQTPTIHNVLIVEVAITMTKKENIMKLIMQIFFVRVVELGIIKIKQVKVVAKHVHLASTKTVCFPQVAKIAQKENMRIVLVLQLVQDAIRLNIRIKQVNRSVKHLIVVRYQQVVNILAI